MGDEHLRWLGEHRFREAVRDAMRRCGMRVWLRDYEAAFPWPRKPFTMAEYRRRRRSR